MSAAECPRCRYGLLLQSVLLGTTDVFKQQGHNRLAGLHDLAALIVLTLARGGDESVERVLARIEISAKTGQTVSDIPSTCGHGGHLS